MSRNDIKLFKEAQSLIHKDALKDGQKKVALLSGGGSGHEPAHGGYIGRGGLDAVVCGAVYSSPTRDAIYSTIASLSSPEVLIIVKNYTGDKLNFGLAAQMAQSTLGKRVEIVTVADDVALLDAKNIAIGARGIAGTVFVHKILGAASAAGASLKELKALGDLVTSSVKTFGVALSSCNLPSSKTLMFEMAEGQMEIGLGIHGERGLGSQVRETADSIVETLLHKLAQHIPAIESKVPLAILLNNLGSTTLMEMAVLSRATIRKLSSQGYTIARFYVGQFLTSMETAGISISILPADDQILAYLDAPTDMRVTFGPGLIDLNDYLLDLTSTGSASTSDSSSSKLVRPPVTVRGPESPKSCQWIIKAIESVGKVLVDNHEKLGHLDSIVGDGDLGQTFLDTVSVISPLLKTWNTTHPATLLTQLSLQLSTSMGGTSGPLYSVFFLNMADFIASIENGPLDASAWINAAINGANGISALGGAQKGDRTMIDALLPALDTLKSGETLTAAATSASNGSNATAQMIPKRGRSAYLQERALGVADPGCAAVELIFQALSHL